MNKLSKAIDQAVMIKVVAYYKTGSIVNYTYQGDGEYNGQKETAKQRAERHMINSKSIIKYTIE